jgi:hypothetical protein
MKTNVTSTLAGLIAERDALNVAISALKKIDTSAETPTAPKVTRKRRGQRGVAIAVESKQAAFGLMLDASAQGLSLMDASRRVSRALGLNTMTVYTNWKKWGPKPVVTVNGDAAEVVQH